MTNKQFEKMLTPELLAKLRRIAAGVVGVYNAEDAVQTALLRVFERLREYRKITPSFLASRVVMICGERRKTRASNASRESPVGTIEDGSLEDCETAERIRTYGLWKNPSGRAED